jgi:endonuclease/exonuclease/phosphatase family metal-dependent hydrolase
MDLRIVSYNVRYFSHALRGLASTRGPKRGIAAALSSLTPPADIICLQEVESISLRSRLAFRAPPGETQLQSFMNELRAQGGDHEYEALDFRAHQLGTRWPLYTTGLAMVVDTTRLRIERRDQAELTRGAVEARICAHARLVDGAGRALHVFNTHLSLPSLLAREPLGAGRVQRAQAQALVELVRERAGGEPFVICGDFNATPGSPLCRWLGDDAGLSSASARLGLAPDFATAGIAHVRMQLDHLWSDRSIEWLDLDGTQTIGDRRSPFHGLSDHVPLIARFRIA